MKKLLVLTITLCLLMSVCPVNASAYTHSHAVCGGDDCAEHWNHEEPCQYAAIINGSAIDLFGYETQYYYLENDVTVDRIAFTHYDTLYLCLNGHTLYYSGINLENYSRLILCDCMGGGQIMPKNGSSAGISITSGSMLMYGGKITGHTNTAITLGGDDDAYPELFVYGGEISGNSGVNGGGIAILANNSLVSLSDLTMKNNTATRGGAIYGVDGQVDIYRSTFTGNEAREGGAMYLKTDYNDLYYDPIMCWLSDVTITDNKTTGGMGGGVAVHGIARLFLGGSTICDNVSDGKACNLYFPAHHFDRDDDGWVPLIEASTNKKICIYVEDAVTPDKPLPFLIGYDAPLSDGIEKQYFSDQGYLVRYNDEDMDLAEGELYVPTPTPTPAPVPPATGDGAPVMLWAAMLLMTAGAAMLLRRRAVR